MRSPALAIDPGTIEQSEQETAGARPKNRRIREKMDEGKEAWPGTYSIAPKPEPGETTGIADDALKVEKLAHDAAEEGNEKADKK